MDLPTIPIFKDSLYLKSFGYGTGQQLIQHHEKLVTESKKEGRGTMSRRMSSAGKSETSAHSLAIRDSCVGDTFNYVVPFNYNPEEKNNDIDRVLNYVLDTYTTKWSSNLICFKLNKQINLLDVNNLTEAHLLSLLNKFIGKGITRKARRHTYYKNSINHLSNLSTGKFFSDIEFLKLVDLAILTEREEESASGEEVRLGYGPGLRGGARSGAATSASASATARSSAGIDITVKEYLINRLLFIFRFIYGIEMKLKTQLLFLEQITGWCNKEGSSYKTNGPNYYGSSLASELTWPDNKLLDWANLFVTAIHTKTSTNKGLLETTGNRCSYNGLDQIFCFVTCQTDQYGLQYLAGTQGEHVMPDVGNEIVFLTDKYSKAGGHEKIIEPIYTYIHNSNIDGRTKIISHLYQSPSTTPPSVRVPTQSPEEGLVRSPDEYKQLDSSLLSLKLRNDGGEKTHFISVVKLLRKNYLDLLLKPPISATIRDNILSLINKSKLGEDITTDIEPIISKLELEPQLSEKIIVAINNIILEHEEEFTLDFNEALSVYGRKKKRVSRKRGSKKGRKRGSKKGRKNNSINNNNRK